MGNNSREHCSARMLDADLNFGSPTEDEVVRHYWFSTLNLELGIDNEIDAPSLGSSSRFVDVFAASTTSVGR